MPLNNLRAIATGSDPRGKTLKKRPDDAMPSAQPNNAGELPLRGDVVRQGSQQPQARKPPPTTSFANVAPKAPAPIANNSLDPRPNAYGAGQVAGQGRADMIQNQPVSANFERGPAVGGTGFVNLGHLLSINRKSGEQNAKQLADKRAKEAAQKQAELEAYKNQFENKAQAGEVFYDKAKADSAIAYDTANPNTAQPLPSSGVSRDSLEGSPTRDNGIPQDTSQYLDQNFLKNQADKAANGYQGPSALAELIGYTDYEKGARKTDDSIQNLGKGNEGIAAEIAKETGMSGAQSAMSAFYSGATNDDLMSVNKKYGNLGKMLDKASVDARARGQLGKTRTENAKDAFKGAADARGQKLAADELAKKEAAAKNQRDITESERTQNVNETQAREDRDNVENNRTGDEDLNYIDDSNLAAKMGLTYEEWVAMGKPQNNEQLGTMSENWAMTQFNDGPGNNFEQVAKKIGRAAALKAYNKWIMSKRSK